MKKLFLLLVAVLTIGLCASAQMRNVRGIVLDSDTGEPLIGASVTAQGDATGVATDVDGVFNISVPANVTKLTVSYVGYETKHVSITPGEIFVKLKPSTNLLDDVIAVAYGTAKKSEYTGSASVVKADQLEDALVTTATSALSGRVAGVQLQSSNGQPGAEPTVLIRGVGSINAGTSPLYVVDGVPYSGDIAGIPTSDIEAMTVLKDAASTALYGARGANGVILITTKKGSEGKARVTFDARWGGNSRATSYYNTIDDPRQYIEQVYKAHNMTARMLLGYNQNEAHQYGLDNLWSSIGYQTWTAPDGQDIIGADGKFNPNATPGYYNAAAGYYYLGDNWRKQLTNGFRQEYNFSIAGGTNRFNYYAGASYLGDEGIIEGSHYKRLSARTSVDYQALDWLKLGTNISYTYVNSGYPGDQLDSGSTANAFYYANTMAPVYPMYVRDAEGNIMYNKVYGLPMFDYGDGQFGAARNYAAMGNPACQLLYNLDDSLMDILDTKFYAVLTPITGLTITGNIGYFVDNTRNHSVQNGLYGQGASDGGQAVQYQSRLRTINAQYLAEYQRTFNELHNASIMLGYESFSRNDENVQALGNNLYNPNNWSINNTIDERKGYGSAGGYATRGWFGRAKYNYAEKYFLQASFRRDASSRFAKDHRWGTFWSASAAWEIAKESFMEDFDNIDMLKFKFSFGQNGNDNVGNYYAYTDQYTMTGANGIFSDATLAYKGNPDLTWETSNNLNTGFDFSFFKGMINGTVEYYQRQVSDMLFNIPVAPSLGYSSIPMNIGSMRNNGLEIELNYRPIDNKNITWDIYANLTLPKNKVLKLSPVLLDGNGNWISGSRIFHEGESMYNMYMVKYAGVNNAEDATDAQKGLAMYWAREFVLEDGTTTRKLGTNDVQKIDEKTGMEVYGDEYATTDYTTARTTNRVSTGNIMPKGYGGFGTSIQAFGFDASVNFAFQFGGKIYDNGYASFMSGLQSDDIGANIHADILNAWTPENTQTDVPRLSTSDQYPNSLSTRFLTSSNYLSLNNVTIGYTLPKSLTSKLMISDVRIYFSGENLALWSKRKGLDPRQSFTASNSYTTYSPIRCLSGGIRLSF